MAVIYIDKLPYEVDAGDNLLHACLSLGFDLPYFCWHPALNSVGACRQCAIKQFEDEEDTKGRIVMACMTPAVDGTHISIDDPEAAAFRAGVIEWLMENHPHDCPVCDEGGECHLQDMTVMTGHIYRRCRFKKRTHRNQYLGPFLNHEMNRCIQCYRCVRFYRDYAGGRDLDVFAARNYVYFGRHEDGVLENEFSGNLVEICPTGVFTDKTLKRHYTRKWDLQTAPSICVHCGLGCNTIPGERYGTLRRIRNRYNGEVNGYFLCDRGRYGYECVNSERRIRRPMLRTGRGEEKQPISKDSILPHLVRLLSDRSRVIGIGSPRASIEANFALRTLVGPDQFSVGICERDVRLLSAIVAILQDGPARSPSLRDIELSDAVFVLGEDVTNTAPRLALALRQSVRQAPMKIADALRIPVWHDAAVRTAIQHANGPLFLAATSSTGLDDVTTESYRAAPDDLARLGFAVAHEVSDDAPPVPDLPAELRPVARRIAQALASAARPLVISGIGCGSEPVIQAAANVAWALCGKGRPAGLCFTMPECNSLGLALMGGDSLGRAFEMAQQGRADTVIVLENDLYRRADAVAVDAFLDTVRNIIVIDHLDHATVSKADVTLPAATFAETSGTLLSSEGRAQRFYSVMTPDGEIQESWKWVRDLLTAAGRADGPVWRTLDEIVAACAHTVPAFKRLREAAPSADFRMAGQKIPREPARYSGRTAMHAQVSVHEPKASDDPDSPFAFSMEGYPGEPPSPLIPFFWAPGWNSVQSVNKFQSEVGGPLHGGDPGVRLLEPAGNGTARYFSDPPRAFERRSDAWLVAPFFHIFGTEELSMLAPAVAERAPRPYLALNPTDAVALDAGPGEEVNLVLGEVGYRLPVILNASLPVGLAGLPVGVPGLIGIDLPAWGRIVKAESA
ncbi:MAG: NADH-quinone oxidoreductase subunit G [Candidatus Methylomirabilota bacterium]|nr:NADH-quinone oxidoreductase subunit NuoG [candidate division NC10 bacterium]PWB46339.1 MAG: NADH-quinone oxidoreductase subunit G [candidate division NC10 bacterium]